MERDPMKSIGAKALIELGCSHHGFVVKEGGRFKSMQTRYFVLHEGCLYYFKDFQSTKEQGAICLAGYELREDLQDDDVYGIRLEPIKPGKKSLYFVLSTKEERKIWVEKFNQEMKRIAGDGGEEYHYCYEGRAGSNAPADEPVHNYEPTSEIETMQPMTSPNSYTKQPGTTLLSTKPAVPPPSLPARTTGPKARSFSACNVDQFMPPGLPAKTQGKASNPLPGLDGGLAKRQAPQPPIKALAPPIQGRESKKDMPPMPNPHTKPVLAKMPPAFPHEDLLKKKAGMEELARKVQQRRSQQKYEIQDIRAKPSVSSDSDSEGSESYLDLGEQDGIIKRGRPAGSSLTKHNERPNVNVDQDRPVENVLPLSAFQSTLARETAECLLNGIKQDGMYLFRQGRTGLQVLTVYTSAGCKHYQVFENSGSLFLKEDEPRFWTLKELVNHYYRNPLPKCDFILRTPYS